MLGLSKPAVFHHAVVRMSTRDRFVYNNTYWRPHKQDELGWHFRDEKDPGIEQFIAHGELYAKLQSKYAELIYNYNAPESQRLRAVFGDTKFNEIDGKRRELALFREKLILRYDAECHELGKRPRWSPEAFQTKLETWRLEILSEILGQQSGSSPKCADEMIEFRAFCAPSVRTFRRDYKRYKECGRDIMGIVHRHHGPGHHVRKTDPDSLAFAHREAMNYMTRTKPSMAKVYLDYQAALWRENTAREGRGEAKLHRVTRYKFESIISKFDAFDKWDGREGRSSAVKYFTMVKRSIEAISVGERIEIDFWNVDLMSLFVETGIRTRLPAAYKAAVEGRRIWFVAAIDIATRYVMAFRASTNPSSVSAAAAIRMIMTDKSHISDMVGAKTPWSGHALPRNILSDNGSEFANDLVEGIMRNVGITFSRPPAGRPDARPFVESLFHSVGPLIASYFEGRTFGSVVEKGDYNPEHHLSLEVDEVIRLFTVAVCDIYHNKPHSGLGGGTPHNAWVRASQEHGILYPAFCLEKMIANFGQTFKRRIGKNGIVFEGLPYANEELHRQRTRFGQMDFEIKVDPENLEHILVRGNEGWFIVKNTVELDSSVSLDEWVTARAQLRNQHAVEAEAGLAAMYSAINRLRQTGESAALRANLTPRHLTSQHYEILNNELFGAWEAVASADLPTLDQAFAIPGDPLRDGAISNSSAVQDFHAERERDGRKMKKLSSPDPALPEVPPFPQSADYYEEY